MTAGLSGGYIHGMVVTEQTFRLSLDLDAEPKQGLAELPPWRRGVLDTGFNASSGVTPRPTNRGERSRGNNVAINIIIVAERMGTPD